MEIIELKVHKGADEVMFIVRQMRDSNLIQGRHFDFAFYPTKWDNFTGTEPAHAIFYFYEEKWATWFALRWL